MLRRSHGLVSHRCATALPSLLLFFILLGTAGWPQNQAPLPVSPECWDYSCMRARSVMTVNFFLLDGRGCKFWIFLCLCKPSALFRKAVPWEPIHPFQSCFLISQAGLERSLRTSYWLLNISEATLPGVEGAAVLRSGWWEGIIPGPCEHQALCSEPFSMVL